MLKHDDLMQRTMLNAEGFIFVLDSRHPKFSTAVAHASTINPEYVELISASLLLYRTAQEATTYLEALVEYLEGKGCDDAVPSVAAIQATLDSAMKIARNGLPKKTQDS